MAPQSDIQEEVILQAVVITDCDENNRNYGTAFSKHIPRVLLPLANAPLLDFTLDWLERCGIDETIVYCRAQPHSDKIRKHCRSFSAHRSDEGMKVCVVASEDCHSLGDAMRDLYAKSVLKGDFVLVMGDLVATLDLQALVTKHKEYRAADKSAIMTCVYMEGKCGEVEAENYATSTLITNASTAKLLHHARPKHSATKLSIPTELLQGNSELQVYSRVYDPSIAICSEVVPSLFSDNFDYGSRDSLIRGVIEQEELLGYTMRCQVVKEGYAARVSSLQQYLRVSEDVLCREAYPMVCEVSLTSHRIRYTHDPFTHTYWEPSSKFHRGGGGGSVVVGAGTEVSPTGHLQHCTVAQHCTIGADVKARSAVIMDNVKIKPGCEVVESVVGDGVVLEERVKVNVGCVLGPGVVLGPDITLPPGTFLTAHPPHDDFDQDAATQEPDPLVCGSKGRAFVIEQEEEDEHEEGSDMEEEEDVSDDEMMDSPHLSDEDEHRENEFQRELLESLTNARREASAAENVILEINASRHAYNVSMEHVLTTVVQGVIRVGEEERAGETNSERLWQGIKLSLATFADVLRNYIRKGRDQILLLNAIELLVKESPKHLPLVQKILYELNQTYEIVDDEVLVHWVQKGGAATTAFPSIQKSLARFIAWLEEEEESEEEQEEEDSS